MGAMTQRQSGAQTARISVATLLRELRRHNFAVLATVGEDGRPAAAGVNYGVSLPDQDLALYVMTRSHLKKARNIARNQWVSLVIPLPRRLLWFLPPPTIQLRGRAEILDGKDAAGIAVFERFWMGRRILTAYEEAQRHGETRVCFLKITPEPVIATYMVRMSIWAIRRRMEAGAAKVILPTHIGQKAAAPHTQPDSSISDDGAGHDTSDSGVPLAESERAR
jgi:hypothetical protein